MRIHHLNCATMCPFGGHLMGRPEPGLGPARMTCHCLLVETDRDGLVLVDTGLGAADVAQPEERLSRFFLALMRPRLDLAETAREQVLALGFSPRDVRHVVLTHLDFDHAGGLADFPDATVHLLADEVAAARRRTTWIERGRYRPRQWTPEPSWQTYSPGGEEWFGFRCVRDLVGLPPEILLVPLPGHTLGHTGVAVRTLGGWLLHAGDAYFYRDEIDPEAPTCPLGLRAYQAFMEADRAARLANQARLRELVRVHGGDVRVLCSHDATLFEAFAGRAVHERAPHVRLVRDSTTSPT